jgi:hypothetical protein
VNAPTLAELQTLVRQAHDAYRAAQEAARLDAAQRIVNIEVAIQRLDQLLGPENAAPYQPGRDIAPTIRSVSAHDDATLAQHAGLALSLILDGLAELTVTTRDIAAVVADLKRRTDAQL